VGDLRNFYPTILAEAERTGIWSGTALELWLALFSAHRANRPWRMGAGGRIPAAAG
jgi:hypothetical protein